MRFRKFNTQYATVNDDLLEQYKLLFPQMKNDNEIVAYLIESRLILRPINSKEDLEDAKKYIANMLYSSIGEWVDSQLRSDMINHLSLCKNCVVFGENGYCPVLGAFVNPHQKACYNIKLK